jgi:hypothetical protein
MLQRVVIKVSKSYLPFQKLLFLVLGLCTFFIGSLIISLAKAKPAFNILAPYGEVIYTYNPECPDQLFIIGTGHRNAVTRVNGSNTQRVQVEVYKIGDRLIRHEGVKLLLPEGFFETKEKRALKECRTSYTELSDEMIEERLSDNTTFVNAEMLLKEAHPIRLRQVEEQDLYWNARESMLRLIRSGNRTPGSSALKSRLDYLQERRTAALLQNAPDVTNEEFKEGYINKRRAILTIGLSHIPDIIKYLRDKRITVRAPLFDKGEEKNYNADLNLIKKNFGVCILLPKTLTDDQEILEMNGLNSGTVQ